MKANDIERLCYQRVLHIPAVVLIKLSNLTRECYILLHCGNFLIKDSRVNRVWFRKKRRKAVDLWEISRRDKIQFW